MKNKQYLLDTNILIEIMDNNPSVIRKLVEKIIVLDLSGDAAKYYGNIKYALEMKGKRVDEFDMIIAGHALCEGLTVVTDNIRHFENVPDIKVENWIQR